MKLSKLSSKGQVVVQEALRKGLETGTPFLVTRKRDLIILKKRQGLTKEEEQEMKELERIWRDIDNGKCKRCSVDEFFAEIRAR